MSKYWWVVTECFRYDGSNHRHPIPDRYCTSPKQVQAFVRIDDRQSTQTGYRLRVTGHGYGIGKKGSQRHLLLLSPSLQPFTSSPSPTHEKAMVHSLDQATRLTTRTSGLFLSLSFPSQHPYLPHAPQVSLGIPHICFFLLLLFSSFQPSVAFFLKIPGTNQAKT